MTQTITLTAEQFTEVAKNIAYILTHEEWKQVSANKYFDKEVRIHESASKFTTTLGNEPLDIVDGLPELSISTEVEVNVNLSDIGDDMEVRFNNTHFYTEQGDEVEITKVDDLLSEVEEEFNIFEANISE